jgi:Mg-chelatase subunit ChlD
MQTQYGDIIPSVAQTLQEICLKNPHIDKELILDVYLLVSNNGKASYLPDEDLLKDIDATDPHFWEVRTDLARRQEFIEKLANSRYMQALVGLGDSLKAVNVFIDHMTKSLTAQKNSKSGPVDHNSGHSVAGYADDDALDQLATEALDPAQALDQILDSKNTYIDAVESKEFSAFVEGAASDANSPMMVSGCGPKSAFRTFTESPGNNLPRSVVQHGIDLPAKFPLMFEWYTKIVEQLGVEKLEDKDTDKDTARTKRDKMEDYSSVTSVDPAEIEKETFEKALGEKSLNVTHNLEQEEGICHVFVLLDVSGSMMAQDVGGRICRAFVANVLTLALLRLATKKRYKVWVMPFEGYVGQIVTASDETSALSAMRWLGTVNYDGGGTDIEGAVLKAYELTLKDKTYEKADIVLITDGCSPISDALVAQKPERTKLRLLMTCQTAADRNFNRLKNACDTWKSVGWNNNTNEFDIGDTVSGITSPQSTI